MKTTTTPHAISADRTKRISTLLGLAVVLAFAQHTATAAVPIVYPVPATVNLGTAGNFSILAGSEITDAGGASSIVTGDVGVYPGTSNGLLISQVVGGTIYARPIDDGLLLQAKNDLTTAYIDAGGRTPGVDYGAVDNQLGGLTLFPGVYRFGHAATANLIGNLTLDANGEVDPVWIFQATSDLIIASDASVTLLGGVTSCDVFWWVGSSATIGTDADFVGNILSDQSIALQTGATLDGSALARIAAVTLDHNTITKSVCTDDMTGGGPGGTAVPDGGSSFLLMGSGLVALVGFKRRAGQPSRMA